MTIGKGTAWGHPGVLSPNSPSFASDAELAAHLADHLPAHLRQSLTADTINRIDRIDGIDTPDKVDLDLTGPLEIPPIALTGGALWRTIGGPGVVGRYATSEARQYACDLAVAAIDGVRRVFVASLVARNRWWTKTAVVMNAQDMGAYRFGHRAHPGDALLDVYEARVALGDVLKIAKRAKLGSHLPHPGITERRVRSVSFHFDQPRQLWLDEHRIGMVEQLSVTVVPDAFTVVV